MAETTVTGVQHHYHIPRRDEGHTLDAVRDAMRQIMEDVREEPDVRVAAGRVYLDSLNP